VFDVSPRTFRSKLSGYTRPKRKAWKEMDEAREAVLTLSRDLVLVHVGSTDVLAHLRGDGKLLKFLLRLDGFLADLRREHLERRGRPLRIVLLSDHGNTSAKVHVASGIRRALRKAGLHVTTHLEEPDDVVAATFGLVSYGALFLSPEHAEDAAIAVAALKAVDIAAWLSDEHEITVVSGDGAARILWRDGPGGLRFAYRPQTADPLRMAEARERLLQDGLLDEQGFASHEDWFALTALGEFPDAPRRLVHALTGEFVDNTATVMLSIRPGYSWGWRSAHAGSWLQGGRMEGTHGGLDRESTLGFFLTTDPSLQPSSVAVVADRALQPFADFGECLTVRTPTPPGEATQGN
jgi:hypothetical protein